MLVRRKLLGLLTAAMMLISMLAFSAPAFADKGGQDHEGACGLAKVEAQAGIADPTGPGASEFALIAPSEVGCTGKG